jgi:hypothetical protein
MRRALTVGVIGGAVGFLLGGAVAAVYVGTGAVVAAAVVLAVEGWVRRRFRHPGVRRLPSFGFLAWGVLPTFAAVANLAREPVRLPELVLGAFAAAWWLVGILLVRGVRGALVPALALTALPWCLGLAQTAERVAFIIREGGMERADGYGSPMAFLIGWTLEVSLLLVPLTLIAVRLALALRRGDADAARG